MSWPFGVTGDHLTGEIEITSDQDGDWLLQTPFLSVRSDDVVFPGGARGTYLSLHPPSGARVAGVAMLTVVQDKLLFMRTFRHAPRRWELEIPRGFIDRHEDAETAARRELAEECGSQPRSLTPLGFMNPDTGFFASDVACFLCTLGVAPKEVGEHAKAPPVLLTVQETLTKIGAGEIRDGFSAYCLAAALGKALLKV